MPEELRPDSLSGAERATPRLEEAWREGNALMDKEVWDSEGHRVGRVTKCFVEEGRLVRAQVTLDKRTKGAFQIPDDVVQFDPGYVVEATEDRVRLKVPTQQIASTPGEPPVGTNVEGHEGAPQDPRRKSR